MLFAFARYSTGKSEMNLRDGEGKGEGEDSDVSDKDEYCNGGVGMFWTDESCTCDGSSRTAGRVPFRCRPTLCEAIPLSVISISTYMVLLGTKTGQPGPDNQRDFLPQGKLCQCSGLQMLTQKKRGILLLAPFRTSTSNQSKRRIQAVG